MKNHEKTWKAMKNHEKHWKTMKNHEKPPLFFRFQLTWQVWVRDPLHMRWHVGLLRQDLATRLSQLFIPKGLIPQKKLKMKPLESVIFLRFLTGFDCWLCFLGVFFEWVLFRCWQLSFAELQIAASLCWSLSLKHHLMGFGSSTVFWRCVDACFGCQPLESLFQAPNKSKKGSL